MIHRLCLLLSIVSSALGPAAAQVRVRVPGGSGPRSLVRHDIQDLLEGRRDFPLRRFNRPAGAPAFRPPSPAPRQRLLAGLRAFLEKRGIAPDAYALQPPRGGIPVRPPRPDSVLIVDGTAAVQRAVTEFLARERRLAESLIQVEARVYRVRNPGGELPERLRREHLGQEDTVFSLEVAEARSLRQALDARSRQEGASIQALTAPRLTVYHGQRANLVVANPLAYVAAYRVITVLGGTTRVVDPVVKHLETGFGLEVKVDLDPENPGRARAGVFYQHAELERPVEERTTARGVVQVPKVNSVELEFTVDLTLPGHLLLASRARPRQGIDLVLLGFQRLELQDARKKKRAAVQGVSPARPTTAAGRRVVRLFIGAGRRDGLEPGREVRFYRTGEHGRPELLFTGTAARVYRDLAVVEASWPARGRPPDVGQAAAWWCAWGPRKL